MAFASMTNIMIAVLLFLSGEIQSFIPKIGKECAGMFLQVSVLFTLLVVLLISQNAVSLLPGPEIFITLFVVPSDMFVH